jgi:hypothetical protein
MNRFTKLALGVVAALAVSPAFADVDPLNNPGSHNPTDLMVLVNDFHGSNLNSTYVIEMNQGVAALFGTLVANATLSTVNSIAATTITNANLTSFLSDSAATSFTFSVQGFDAAGGNGVTPSSAKTPGAYTSVFTTSAGGNVVKNTGQSALNGLFTTAQNSFAAGSGGPADSVSGAGTDSTGYLASGDVLSTQGYGGYASGVSDWVAANTSTQLFGVTGNANNTSGKLQSYILGTVKLDLVSKSVIFSANQTTVPVPGAVWLLGSGLLGLVGVSRRRSV